VIMAWMRDAAGPGRISRSARSVSHRWLRAGVARSRTADGRRLARPPSPPVRDQRTRDGVARISLISRASGARLQRQFAMDAPGPRLSRRRRWGVATAIVIAFAVAFLATDMTSSTSRPTAARSALGEAAAPSARRLTSVAPLPDLAARVRSRASRATAADRAASRPVASADVQPAGTAVESPSPASPLSQAPAAASPAPAASPPPATSAPRRTASPAPRPSPQPSGSFDSSGAASDSP
jgi:hypothetical protein